MSFSVSLYYQRRGDISLSVGLNSSALAKELNILQEKAQAMLDANAFVHWVRGFR